MSFHISFFARDVQSAHAKLREAYAPAAVKALIELALAGIPAITPAIQGYASNGASAPIPTQAPWGRGDAEKAKAFAPAAPRAPVLCGIKVEAVGHIDENGHTSNIGTFRVEPLFD